LFNFLTGIRRPVQEYPEAVAPHGDADSAARGVLSVSATPQASEKAHGPKAYIKAQRTSI